MQAPLIIIGMHRSGTSMASKILSENGIFPGKDIDRHYESLFFRGLNQFCFRQAGAFWDAPENMLFTDDYFETQMSLFFKKQLIRFLKRKFGCSYTKTSNQEKRFMWKDPRSTFTEHIWRKIFPDAKIIHIYRHPVDVAVSLKNREENFRKQTIRRRRSGIKKHINEFFKSDKRIYSESVRALNTAASVELWELYVNRAFQIKENILHLSYEEVLLNPQNEFARIENFLGIKLNKSSSDTLNRGRAFAFCRNNEACKFFEQSPKTEMIKKLNYDKIVGTLKTEKT